MAVATASEKLLSRLKVTHYDFDPDSADPVDVAWVDMRDFDTFLASFFRTVGTGNIDTYKIIANSASDGSGTDVEIKTKTLTNVQPNALGDYNFLECTAEEINQAGVTAGVADLRYVSLQLEFATSTDEGVVTYVRGGIRQYTGLTADNIS